MAALKLDLEWRTTLMSLLLFPGLIALGFWQLDRADEKADIAHRESERAMAAAVSLDQLTAVAREEQAFRKVIVSGHYVEDAVIFLDNQMRDGRYGHDVYGVFYDQPSEQYVLLNRGWVEGDSSRRSLPEVDVPSGEFALSATAYVPPGKPYLLAEDQFADLKWPLLVQTVASDALHELLKEKFAGQVFATELRLAAGSPTGFRRDWPVLNVSPEKHQGYALQWFTMAAALLLFFVFRSSNILSFRRGRSSSGSIDTKEH
ncbi:SURF1 family protein [Congregibacter variabilis]|uniref:SURF1-like protein n=1 Tax=Congregibacter variabilis TaxID=3081200 RepID=A0ABZ0I147_9GAMM|nr:SURF1 family protein [Congregibacter sp. IMCC43200]